MNLSWGFSYTWIKPHNEWRISNIYFTVIIQIVKNTCTLDTVMKILISFVDYSNGNQKNGHHYSNKAYTNDQDTDKKMAAMDEKSLKLSVSPDLRQKRHNSPTGSVKSDLLFVQWADEQKRSIAFNPSPIGSIKSSKSPFSSPFK